MRRLASSTKEKKRRRIISRKQNNPKKREGLLETKRREKREICFGSGEGRHVPMPFRKLTLPNNVLKVELELTG